MNILGIETSCDDTAVAIVRDGQKVLSSNVSSQITVHAKFGGVVPEIAAREHLRLLAPLVKKSFAEAGMSLSDIDAIAVTQGPGLIGSLLIGISYAKGLALGSGLPLLPVDHVHGHVHGAFLSLAEEEQTIEFPLLALVASGGHCNLYYMSSLTDYQLLGWTVDDACGECFDKVAKKMGFAYPGGPTIERLARCGDENRYVMPRMIEQKDRIEFSYSGLKTHMVNLITRQKKPLNDQVKADLSAAFQSEALGQLVRKIEAAHKLKPNIRGVVISGGVAANGYFRSLLEKRLSVPSYFPNLKYCSDNAAMIASYGYHLMNSSKKLPLLDEWDAYSRYNFKRYITPLEEL